LQYLKEQKIAVVSKGKDVDYLRRLVETIRPLMTQSARYKQITIYVADSPLCEARSLPGGTLVFFSGLIEAAESEAALVGVVAHELSHLDRDHLLVRLKQMKRAEQTLSGQAKDFSPQNLIASTTAMVRLWTRPFRPEDERVADLDAVRWTYKAGYDPREMARVLAKIAQREQNLPAMMPSMFRSHPPADERRQALSDEYEKLQKENPKVRLYVGKENLKRRVARSQQEFAQ
jgi:beta-barrel assembly-enhancing protease